MGTPHTPGYTYPTNGYSYPVGTTQTEYSPPPPSDNSGLANNIVNNNSTLTNNNNNNNMGSMGYQTSPTATTTSPPHPVSLVRAVDLMDPGQWLQLLLVRPV